MPTDAERRVLAALERRRETIIALLQQMVRTVSVNPRFDPRSPGEAAMAALVQGHYRRLGIPVETVEVAAGRPNVIARWPGRTGTPTLLVNCHLDTVTPYDATIWLDPERDVWLDGWSVEPFAGERRDGYIWGRGSADHKLPVAATLAALDALRSEGVELAGSLLVVHDVDEESGGEAGMRYLAQHGLVHADRALYACTTDFTPAALGFFSALGQENVIRALQGTQRYRIVVGGRTYHALTPRLGRNAAENALEVLAVLHRFMDEVNAHPDELTGTGQPLMRLVRVDSEAPTASRPAQATVLHVVRRLPPGTDPDAAYADLRRTVEGVARPEEGFTVRCELVANLPANCVPADDPLVQALVDACRDVRGREPRVTGLPASVGISQFLAYDPVPTVMFGYGVLNFHHAFDERVPEAAVVDTAKVYALAFMRYLGVAAGG